MGIFDFIKGKKETYLPVEIRAGITEDIPDFSDIVAEIKKYRPQIQTSMTSILGKGYLEVGGGIAPLWPIPEPFIEFLFNYSDILRNIIRTLRVELFKNGIEVQPKYYSKCLDCGKEFDEEFDRCPECGSKNLKYPSDEEKKRIEEFIQKVNEADMTLLDVLGQIEDDLNQYDNAYLYFMKDYYFNDEGELIGAELKEIYRIHPNKVIKIMDGYGRFGYSNGEEVYVCLEHRNTLQRKREYCK
ncbi:MAG: hypothetical protein DRN30_02900, partial [Thermoplasmata archaeon]